MTTKAVVQRPKAIIGHDKKVRYVGRLIGKKRCKNNIKKPTVTPPRNLQKLFDSCQEVFKGPGTVPSPDDVQKLCHILDFMIPEDVGLSENLQFFKVRDEVKEAPRVTYTTIYKCDKFSLCMFFLPTGGVIPLHNHPGMTVFSKLLLGKMHIKSYDWAVDKSSSGDSSQSVRLAELKADRVFTAPCDASVLYPTRGGNIHEFTAVTPCAVLDVLGPPYSTEDGRDCSYYKDFPYSAFPDRGDNGITKEKGKCYGWLQEIEIPENSEMDGIEYLGPQIVVDMSH